MKYILPILLFCTLVLNNSYGQTNTSSGLKGLYADLDILDKLVAIEIDTTIEYTEKDSLQNKIDLIVDREMFFIICFDSLGHNTCDSSKAVIDYSNFKAAIRKGYDLRCKWLPKRKHLRTRWISTAHTKNDTIRKEEHDFIGINFGGDTKPVGTQKPLLWESKYQYKEAKIEFRASSNKDGADNFIIYTSKDTLLNKQILPALEYTDYTGIQMPRKEITKAFRSHIFLSVSNKMAKNYSPGAYGAHIIIRPTVPLVIPNGRKYYTLSKVKV